MPSHMPCLLPSSEVDVGLSGQTESPDTPEPPRGGRRQPAGHATQRPLYDTRYRREPPSLQLSMAHMILLISK